MSESARHDPSTGWIGAEAAALHEQWYEDRAGHARRRAREELEASLVAQEQLLERHTGAPIVEQTSTDPDVPVGEDAALVTAGESPEDAGTHGGRHGSAEPDHTPEDPETPARRAAVEPLLERGERTFEGAGAHPLDEQ